MSFVVKKAERKNVKLKLGISAASGQGKTYSALLLAKGLVGDWEKVGLIDTENSSGELYSHLGPYKHLDFQPPYGPDRYIEAMKAMVAAGVECVILDSASHEWDGQGGCLEIVEKLKPTLKNEFAAWSKVSPMHKKFIDAVMQLPVHVVTTTRRKQDWVLEMNDRGKQTPRKVGMKEIQREGFEYELTVAFELDSVHQATASKDRTGLFATQVPFVITEATGETLRKWNDTGAVVDTAAERQEAAERTKVQELCKAFVAKFPETDLRMAMKERFGVSGTKEMDMTKLGEFKKFLEEELAYQGAPDAAL